MTFFPAEMILVTERTTSGITFFFPRLNHAISRLTSSFFFFFFLGHRRSTSLAVFALQRGDLFPDAIRGLSRLQASLLTPWAP